MKFYDVQQGSGEWLNLRLAIPTASRFDCIISAATLKPLNGKGAQTYRHELLAEWLYGLPCDAASTQFMERGTALECNARAWYEFKYDVEVTNGGFCTTDDELIGDSPDGLIGDDGCLEIKTLGLKAHVGHMVGDLDITAYRPQVHGHLFVTGRQWCDVVFYHPTLKSIRRRVERDDDIMDSFDEALSRFNKKLKRDQDLLADDKRKIDEQIRSVA